MTQGTGKLKFRKLLSSVFSDPDYVKFFASTLGFGIILLGYAYSASFFRSFGLSLFQLDMSVFDILYRGIAILKNPYVFAVVILVLLLVPAVFSLVSKYLHSYQFAFYSVLSVILVFGILWGGQYRGNSDARSVWAGGSGKAIRCTLQVDDPTKQPELQALKAKIQELSVSNSLRLIHWSDHTVYLVPVFSNADEAQLVGDAYVIHTEDINFCYTTGSI